LGYENRCRRLQIIDIANLDTAIERFLFSWRHPQAGAAAARGGSRARMVPARAGGGNHATRATGGHFLQNFSRDRSFQERRKQ
jgi:hypothetical protein